MKTIKDSKMTNLKRKTLNRDGILVGVYACEECEMRTIFPEEHNCTTKEVKK